MNNTERIIAVRNLIGTIIAHLNVLEQSDYDYSEHKAALRRLDYDMYLRSKCMCEPDTERAEEEEECGHCHGTGMKPDTSSDTCAKCGGSGYVTKVVQ